MLDNGGAQNIFGSTSAQVQEGPMAFEQNKTWYCGRRPKQDDFDDLEPFESEEEGGEDDDANEDENEEVDFDNPKFKKSDMWHDYAEDLDFEE
jgi:hypothetical protein